MKSLILLFLTAFTLQAQTIHTTIVSPNVNVAEQLSNDFSPDHEKLWCVTAWTVEPSPSFSLIRIQRIEPAEVSSTATHITFKGNECIRDGKRLPTIHSHPIGNCQASPADMETIASRQALFDGILCGDKFLVWNFYRQIFDASMYEMTKDIEIQSLVAAPGGSQK
jgi:hypothetical protein